MFICLELQCDSCRLFPYVTTGLETQRGCLKVTRSAILNPYVTNVIYIYGAPILDVSRSHTTTHHSR